MLKLASILLYAVSIGLVATGFVFMFHYGDYDEKYNTFGSKFGHVVGGDAYNYIIIGVRGLGFIVTGLISALAASTLLVIDVISKKNALSQNIQHRSDEIPLNIESTV